MSDDLDNLTTSQREALGHLQSITNGADIPSEIAILSSVNWDVQVQFIKALGKISTHVIDSKQQRLYSTRSRLRVGQRLNRCRSTTRGKACRHPTERMYVLYYAFMVPL